jgi:hypothetical protein
MGAGSIGTVPRKVQDLLAGAASTPAAAVATLPGGLS